MSSCTNVHYICINNQKYFCVSWQEIKAQGFKEFLYKKNMLSFCGKVHQSKSVRAK